MKPKTVQQQLAALALAVAKTQDAVGKLHEQRRAERPDVVPIDVALTDRLVIMRVANGYAVEWVPVVTTKKTYIARDRHELAELIRELLGEARP